MSKYEPVSAEVVAALQTALGAEYVRTDAETLEKYKTDEETDPRYHHLPEVVVWPGSTEEVAAVMKIANQYNVPVTPAVQGPVFPAGRSCLWRYRSAVGTDGQNRRAEY